MLNKLPRELSWAAKLENPSLKETQQVAQMVKNLPAMQETRIQTLGWEDLLEKGLATHSNFLAWRIPWTEELGGIQSMVGHTDRLTLSLSTSSIKTGQTMSSASLEVFKQKHPGFRGQTLTECLLCQVSRGGFPDAEQSGSGSD